MSNPTYPNDEQAARGLGNVAGNTHGQQIPEPSYAGGGTDGELEQMLPPEHYDGDSEQYDMAIAKVKSWHLKALKAAELRARIDEAEQAISRKNSDYTSDYLEDRIANLKAALKDQEAA